MRVRALLFLAALLLPAAAAATSVVSWTLRDLAREADVVAVARVEAVESAWRDGRIWTRARLTPERLIKGAAREPLEIESPGGEVDGIGQHISGAARFEAGERVVVFLEAHPTRGVFRVLGLSLGAWRIEGPEVVRDLSGLRLLVPDPAGDLRVAPAPAPRAPLETFLRDVEAATAP